MNLRDQGQGPSIANMSAGVGGVYQGPFHVIISPKIGVASIPSPDEGIRTGGPELRALKLSPFISGAIGVCVLLVLCTRGVLTGYNIGLVR